MESFNRNQIIFLRDLGETKMLMSITRVKERFTNFLFVKERCFSATEKV